MTITHRRFCETKEYGGSTMGLWFFDGEFECFVLEDERNDLKKIPGETRIPAGKYQLGLRTRGPKHEKYLARFRDFHVGMIEVLGVPGRSDILIHTGNTEADTDGCILVGDAITNGKYGQAFLSHSTTAYMRIYQKIAPLLANKKPVELVIYNEGDLWA